MAPAILLMLAGLASGWLTTWPALGSQANSIGAGLFGVVLAAYLWLHAGVRSRARLAAVVLAAIVGDYVMMAVGLAILILMVAVSNHVNLTPFIATALAGAVGAAVIALVFLQVLPSKRDQLGLEIACCAIAGGLAGAVWVLAGFASIRWLAQLPLWYGAVAGVLGLVAHLRWRPPAASTTTLRLVAGTGFAGVCALLVFGDALRAAAQPAPVMVRVDSASGGATREARRKSASEAPPLVDLPESLSVPASDMFTTGLIAGFTCFPPNHVLVTPDPKEVDATQLRLPTRHEHRLQCFPEKEGPQSLSTTRVVIAQYPNDAWARYDLRNQGGYSGLIVDPRNVTRILKGSRPIFAINDTTYWASGDKVIAIGGNVPSEILDAFIDAYLKRYPNTLEPKFDLPYLSPQ